MSWHCRMSWALLASWDSTVECCSGGGMSRGVAVQVLRLIVYDDERELCCSYIVHMHAL